MLKLSAKYTEKFVNAHELDAMKSYVKAADELIDKASGQGSDFLGWVDLPVNYDKDEYARIKAAAAKIRAQADILIVIGIGGSYLGARAAIEFLKSPNYNVVTKDTPQIFFSGNSISASALNELLSICEDKKFAVNVISKSGTTTEPSIAFKFFKELLVKQHGEDKAKDYIYVTTDKNAAKSKLKEYADGMGLQDSTFVVPDNVGGRFSVLTAVGLLPIAVAGIDIDQMMAGAAQARLDFKDIDIEKNDCYKYAVIRNILYRKGMTTEIFAAYEPCMTMMNEWLKQLFGESEGKDQKGIYPSSVIFSTDLHSLGQYIQDGVRNIFETVIDIKDMGTDREITMGDLSDPDGLNYLAGKMVSYVNEQAMLGTIAAHTTGGVPNLVFSLDKNDEYNLGYMFYFFEKACALSGYISGVNPFDQPGVEEYKKCMFALLNKPNSKLTRDDILKKL